MPVVKADALTEGNNNRWNLVLPAWVNASTEAEREALNSWKVRITLEDEKGNKETSGVVAITVQQDRKIELIVDNIADPDRTDHSHAASALADGEDGVVMDLLLTDAFGDTTDNKGNTLVDDVMTPELYDSNDKKSRSPKRLAPMKRHVCLSRNAIKRRERSRSPVRYQALSAGKPKRMPMATVIMLT